MAVTLSAADLNRVKRTDSIATSINTTFLAFSALLANSTFGVPVTPVALQAPLPAAQFGPDLVSPTLVFAEVNLTSLRLRLAFSEAVVLGQMLVGGASFVRDDLGSSVSMSLELISEYPSEVDASSVFDFQVSARDFVAIAEDVRLLRSSLRTFVSLAGGFVSDHNGNSLTNHSMVSVVIQQSDVVAPVMARADLDVNASFVDLHFSEMMNWSSIDLSAISLGFSSSQFIGLTNATFIALNQTSARVSFGIAFVSQLKHLRLLLHPATSAICMQAAFGKDMFGNWLSEIPCGSGLLVSTFTADQLAARLESFSIIWDQHAVLELNFDEPIDPLSFTPSSLSLMSSNSILNLSIDAVTSTSYDEDVLVSRLTVTLTADLTDQLHLTGTCLRSSDCALSARPNFVTDLSGNVYAAFQQLDHAVLLSEDVLPPQPMAFRLDLNAGILEVSFSEPINASSLNVTGLELTNSP
jgi:hypothetical protein